MTRIAAGDSDHVLPWEVSPLFRQWLELHYPQRGPHHGPHSRHARWQGLRQRLRHTNEGRVNPP